MRLNGRIFSLGLLGAGLFAIGCGEGTSGDGGTGCATNNDCRSNEICHPIAKFCVKTCSSTNDCTNTGNTLCATYTWVPSLPDGGVGAYPPDAGPVTTAPTKICQCPSTASCQGSSTQGSDAICGDEDKVCERRCVSSNECRSNRTCQVATGQCRTPPPAATTCNASNPQPDVCQNGQTCSSNICQAVPSPNCGNFTSGHPGYSWSPSNNAPVIYSIASVGGFPVFSDTFCPGLYHYRYTVSAYWVQGTFPTSGMGIQGILHYVKDDGSESSQLPSILGVMVTNSGHNAQFEAHFCAGVSTSLTVGLHFFTGGVSGNGACGTEP